MKSLALGTLVLSIACLTASAEVITFTYSDPITGGVKTNNTGSHTTAATAVSESAGITGSVTVTASGPAIHTSTSCVTTGCADMNTFTTNGETLTYNSSTKEYTLSGAGINGGVALQITAGTGVGGGLTGIGTGNPVNGTSAHATLYYGTVVNDEGNTWTYTGLFTENPSPYLQSVQNYFYGSSSPALDYGEIRINFTSSQVSPCTGNCTTAPPFTATSIQGETVQLSNVAFPEPDTFFPLSMGLASVAFMLVRRRYSTI